MAYVTKVITDESQVPEGYVRICDMTPDVTLQKTISKMQLDGLVPAVKYMATAKHFTGPVWVDAAITNQLLKPTPLLNYAHAKAVSAGSTKFVSITAVPDRIDSVLERIAISLDLIADAATRLATASEGKQAEWDSPQS